MSIESSEKKILITGGTGFLGRRLVADLASGHRLRLLVRPTSSRERFPEGVVFAEGDVTDADSVERAARGCDAVIHAAALVKILAPAGEFDRINVGGIRNVLAAAARAGTRRVIYVSSFIALGPTEGAPGGILDEAAEPTERRWINHYERTKTQADRYARKAIETGSPVNIVYPGVIYGPGEMTEGNIVVHHILDLLHGRLPGLLGKAERRWNYSHVDDVAAGVRGVLERAEPGARYVLGGENVLQEDFYRLVAELAGVKVPTFRFPDLLAKTAGLLDRELSRLRGRTPKLTPDLVEIYRHDWAYSSAKAERELGYRPRSFRDGLTDTLRWLRETGQCPA